MAARQRLSLWERLFLGGFVVFSVFPILVAVASSFKPGRDIFTYKPVLFFRPTLENYVDLFSTWNRFEAGLFNSLVVTIGAIALTLVACLPAAYAMSRIPRHGIGRSSLTLLVVEMLPPLVVAVPLFPIFSYVGLDNSRFGLMLVYATFEVTLSTFILKTFIDGVPVEIEEAAAIDGCRGIQRFFRIVLPLIVPGIITVAIFVALFAWNDFMFGLILTTSRTQTAPVVLADMLAGIGEGTATWATSSPPRLSRCCRFWRSPGSSSASSCRKGSSAPSGAERDNEPDGSADTECAVASRHDVGRHRFGGCSRVTGGDGLDNAHVVPHGRQDEFVMEAALLLPDETDLDRVDAIGIGDDLVSKCLDDRVVQPPVDLLCGKHEIPGDRMVRPKPADGLYDRLVVPSQRGDGRGRRRSREFRNGFALDEQPELEGVADEIDVYAGDLQAALRDRRDQPFRLESRDEFTDGSKRQARQFDELPLAHELTGADVARQQVPREAVVGLFAEVRSVKRHGRDSKHQGSVKFG